MNEILDFLGKLAFYFVLLSALAFPIWLNVERRRNQAEKKRTEEVLKSTRHDTSGLHIFDGA